MAPFPHSLERFPLWTLFPAFMMLKNDPCVLLSGSERVHVSPSFSTLCGSGGKSQPGDPVPAIKCVTGRRVSAGRKMCVVQHIDGVCGLSLIIIHAAASCGSTPCLSWVSLVLCTSNCYIVLSLTLCPLNADFSWVPLHDRGP